MASIPLFKRAVIQSSIGFSALRWIYRKWTKRLRDESALQAELEIVRRESDKRQYYLSLATESIYWELDCKQDRIKWGSGYENFFKQKRDGREETSKHWESIVHPEDLERTLRSFNQSLAGTDSQWEFEYRIQSRQDEITYVLDRAFILRDGSGIPVQVFGALSNISKTVQANLAQEESEKKFRDVVENLNDVFYNHSPTRGTMLYINKMYEKIWGLTTDSLYASPKSFLDPVHPEDRHILYESFTRQMGGEATDVEYRITKPDGSVAWIRDIGIPLPGIDGPATQIVGTARDITELKKFTSALEKSQQNLERLGADLEKKQGRLLVAQEVAKIGSWDVDFVTGKVDWSLEMFRLFGRDPDTFTLNLDAVFTGIHPEDREWVRAKFMAAMTSHEPHLIHHRTIDAAGNVRHIEARFQFFFDAENNPVSAVGTCQDITNRRHLEEERERLTTAIEQSDDMIAITDREGRFLYVNGAFERITGFSRKEAIGQNHRITKGGTHSKDFYQEFWNTLNAGKTWKGIFNNRKKSGDLYPEESVVSPIRNQLGQVIGFVSIKSDATEKIAREERSNEAQKMEAIGRLAGGIAHDFNNMLTVILARSELSLTMETLTPSLSKTLNLIQNAATRSADLTKRLLTFARRQAQSPSVLHLSIGIGKLEPIIRSIVGEDIDLRITSTNDLWPIFIDTELLDQSIVNLCQNARDAIQKKPARTAGRIDIELSNTTLDGDSGVDRKDYLQILVRDDGIGMDLQTQSRAFEPFFSTKEIGSGTGLGLAMTHGIISQSMGIINIHSQPGVGTEIRILLPRYQDEASGAESGSAIVAPGNGERILLVEDEIMVLESTADMLRQLGYEVTATQCPLDALQRISESDLDIDMIITDLVMPSMNGWDLIQRVRALRPTIRYIIISGYTSGIVEEKLLIESGDHFLAKPFTSLALSAAVRRVLLG